MSSDEYKRLRAEWYQKLKDLDFVDIEQDDDKLKAWHSFRWLNNHQYSKKPTAKLSSLEETDKTYMRNQQATHDYFYYANQFLNSHKFEKEIHKIIWEEHVKGLGVKLIAKQLTQDGVYDTNHNEIWRIIKHYKKILLSQIE